ncbi:MAG: zinc ribbon domain-containing protein, partial [Mariprofundaceae bacterium]|nr:zinc ribbon domain-containing protein [Mariprofundaceae bacterium]
RRGTKFSNLLHGMCYCIHCHGNMRYINNSDKRGQYIYLTCSNAHRKLGCDHRKYFPYQKIETLVLMEVAQKVDWYSLVAGVQTNLAELKRKQASLIAQLTDAESRASRYAGLFEVATGDALDLAQARYLEILNEQAEVRNELASIEDDIAAHIMPDADAIKSKMNHAIARLRTETDEHELFELRATINAALRDSVKLVFGGHPDGEVAVGFSVLGEPVQPLIYGDRSLKITSASSSLEEAKRVIDGLGAQVETYQCELDKAYHEMGTLLGVKHHADGAVIVKIPPIVEQQDFPPSRSIV